MQTHTPIRRTPPTRVTNVNLDDLSFRPLGHAQGTTPSGHRTARPPRNRPAAQPRGLHLAPWEKPSPAAHTPPPGVFPEFRADRTVTLALKVSDAVRWSVRQALRDHDAVLADVDARVWGRPGDPARQLYPTEEPQVVHESMGWSAAHYALLPLARKLPVGQQHVISDERVWDMERRFDLPPVEKDHNRAAQITHIASAYADRRGHPGSMERRLMEDISDGHWLLNDLSTHFYLAHDGLLLTLPGQEPITVRRPDIIPTLLYWATPLRCSTFQPRARMMAAQHVQRLRPQVFRAALQVALDAVETAWPEFSALARDFRALHRLPAFTQGPGIVFTQARTIAGAPWPYATLRSEVWCSDWTRGQLTALSSGEIAPCARGRATPLPWTRAAARRSS